MIPIFVKSFGEVIYLNLEVREEFMERVAISIGCSVQQMKEALANVLLRTNAIQYSEVQAEFERLSEAMQKVKESLYVYVKQGRRIK